MRRTTGFTHVRISFYVPVTLRRLRRNLGIRHMQDPWKVMEGHGRFHLNYGCTHVRARSHFTYQLRYADFDVAWAYAHRSGEDFTY